MTSTRPERSAGSGTGDFAPALPTVPTPTDAATRDRRLVLVAPGGPVEMPAAHRQRLDLRADRLIRRAESVGAPVTYLGVSRRFDEPRLYPGPDTDWVLLRLADDPLFRDGRFPVPRRERQQLQRLVAAGIDMDELLVAHELSATTVREAAPTLARTGPSPISAELAGRLIEHPGPAASTRRFTDRAGRAAETAQRTAATVGRGALTAAKFAAIGAGAAAVAPLALAAAMLDPVIFGVRRVGGQPEVVQVFELVRWEW